MNNFTEQYISQFQKVDYKLVLLPSDDIKDKVKIVQTDFASQYKYSSPLPPAQIHLLSFTQLVHLEKRVIQKLEMIATATKPFLVEFDSYDSLPSHSIFFNISSKHQIIDFIKSIKTELHQTLKIDEDYKPFYNPHPSLMLAQKLKPWQYEQAIAKYVHSSFSEKFISNEMVLLRKKEQDNNYQFINRIPFLGKKNKPIQISLF